MKESGGLGVYHGSDITSVSFHKSLLTLLAVDDFKNMEVFISVFSKNVEL